MSLVKGWQKIASDDLAQFKAWANEFPGYNWGMATGAASGVVVINVDGQDGRLSLVDLKRQCLTLPAFESHRPVNHLILNQSILTQRNLPLCSPRSEVYAFPLAAGRAMSGSSQSLDGVARPR